VFSTRVDETKVIRRLIDEHGGIDEVLGRNDRPRAREPSSPGRTDPAHEEIADLKERLAYALQQVRELSARVPRSELHSI
jgi:hypothetical protein